MSLETAKKWVLIFIVLSIVACLAGLFLFEQGTAQATYTAVAAIGCIVAGACVLLKWCRCPWCGKLLVQNLFNMTNCPSCRRDLTTGKKKKGKGGRR